MLCAVYKSNKKNLAYLYVLHKNGFDRVPAPLLQQFGDPIFVMLLDLNKRNKLAVVSIEKVRENLLTEGFFLQLASPLDETLSHIRSQNSKIF